jgi:hypothetical protein
MTIVQKYAGSPFLYDADTGDIIGVKDPDGSELLFMRIPHVASFYDTTHQTATANTATAVGCNTADISRGISVVSGNRFTVSRKGTYNFQFSAQLLNTDSAEHNISIWFRKNGNDVANSTTDITVPSRHGSVDGAEVAAWNFFIDLLAGEYVQLMWSTPSTAVSLDYTAARTAPVRPAVPSVIVTMNEIDGSYP